MTPQQQIQALEALGITRYRISCDTGISQQCLGHWVSGKRKPDMDRMKTCRMVNELEAYYQKATEKK